MQDVGATSGPAHADGCAELTRADANDSDGFAQSVPSPSQFPAFRDSRIRPSSTGVRFARTRMWRMGHAAVSTTQIYAAAIDEGRRGTMPAMGFRPAATPKKRAKRSA